MFGSSLPSVLGCFGSHQSLLGYRSRHCHGINFTQNPAASGRRLSVVVNNTQLVFAQTMQLIQVDAVFPNEVSQDEEEHGVFEFVLGVDLFPALGQMAFKFPQLVWLFDPRCYLPRFLDGCFQLPMQGAIEGSTRNGLLLR